MNKSMSWLGNMFGSNAVSNVAAAAVVGGAKGVPNMVNSGIGVPIVPKGEGEEKQQGGMKMGRIVAAGAAKPKANAAIARQFGM